MREAFEARGKNAKESIFVCTRKPGLVHHKVVVDNILSNRRFSRIPQGDSKAKIEA
jgi:hypothetical protein